MIEVATVDCRSDTKALGPYAGSTPEVLGKPPERPAFCGMKEDTFVFVLLLAAPASRGLLRIAVNPRDEAGVLL